MSRWIYDGYTKVHDNSRKHMIEKWCYRCSDCGHIVRTEPKRTAILSYTLCPNCGADMRKEGESKDELEKSCLNCGTSECELGNRARYGFCGNWTMREGDNK